MPPSNLLGFSSKSLLRALQPRLGKHLGPFQKQEKHFFCSFFLTVFACNFSSGLWVEWFHRGFGGNGSFGALGGRFESCTSKELERGIRRKAAASPLSGAVGRAKPSGLCEVISYVFKNENLHWKLAPGACNGRNLFHPRLGAGATVKEYLKAYMPLTRYTHIHFQNGRVGARLLPT